MIAAKRDNHRSDRVAARVRDELSSILLKDFNDPRLAGVVVSRVAVTGDLSAVRVAFLVMGDAPDQAKANAALVALRKVSPAVRSAMAPRLGLRRAPTFEFEVDRGREQADRLDALLAEVSSDARGAAKS